MILGPTLVPMAVLAMEQKESNMICTWAPSRGQGAGSRKTAMQQRPGGRHAVGSVGNVG